MRAHPASHGPSYALLGSALFALVGSPVWAGEHPVVEATAAAPVAGLATAWVAAALSLLGSFFAASLVVQARRQVADPVEPAESEATRGVAPAA